MIKDRLISLYSSISHSSGINDLLINKILERDILFLLAYHKINYLTLENHIIELKKYFNNFISLDDCIDFDGNIKINGPSIGITFDDGYSDVIEDAVKIGEKYSVPMTFYLPTEFISTGKPCWFMTLPLISVNLNKGYYDILGKKIYKKDHNDSMFLHRVTEQIQNKLAEPKIIRELICNLEKHLGQDIINNIYNQLPKPISWSRVKEISEKNNRLFTFGSHTVSHPFLSMLDDKMIVNEFINSNTKISKYTGTNVDHFCYPYGNMNAIGQNAPDLSNDYYLTATTMNRGAVINTENPFLMHRIPAYEKDSPKILLTKVCHEGLKILINK